jgi:hypothetical protein
MKKGSLSGLLTISWSTFNTKTKYKIYFIAVEYSVKPELIPVNGELVTKGTTVYMVLFLVIFLGR